MDYLRVSMVLVIILSWNLKFSDSKSNDGNSCQSAQGTQLKKCGRQNITEKECKDLGCCYTNSPSLLKNNVTWRCVEEIKAVCVYYTEPICGKYLHEDFFNQTRNKTKGKNFISTNLGLNGTEELFQSFFKGLDISREPNVESQKCYDLIKPAMCKYGLRSCYEDGTPQDTCREDCDYIYGICGKHLQKLIGVIQYIKAKKDIEWYNVNLPNCSNLNYSYDYPKTANRTCRKLFLGVDRRRPVPKEPGEEGSLIYILIASVAFMIVLLLLSTMCYIRNRIRRRKLNEKEYEFLRNMKSIRDRLHDYSINDNLELLTSAHPGDLIQYPLDCVEYVRDLGEGQFGKVFQGRVHGLVKEEEGSTDVAVKCLKEGSSEKAMQAFHQEVALMSVLQHANVLRLLAVSTEEEPYCMIFEFMENGDLNEYLRNSKGDFKVEELVKNCRDVAAGMEYLSSKKFLHRDLAARNCLVGSSGIVKIADFGMSRNIYESDYYRVGGEVMLPIRWMPPEAILYGKFTVAADIYSYGILMWEVFSYAAQPFYGYSNKEVVEFIKKGTLLSQPDDCPEWIYNVMLQCWKFKPEERILFTAILKVFDARYELLGQSAEYDNPILPYDTPKNRNRVTISSVGGNEMIGQDLVSEKYDNPKFEEETTYENVQKKSNLEQVPLQDMAHGSHLSPPPFYYNLSPSTSKESAISNVLGNEDQGENYLTPSMSKKQVENGCLNYAFDEDDNGTNSRTQSASSRQGLGVAETQQPLPQNGKKREALLPRRLLTPNGVRSLIKSGSFGSGKSIKDVLKEEERYVIPSRKRVSWPNVLVENDIPLENSTASAPDLLNYQSHGNGIAPKIVEQRQMVH